MFDVDEEVKKHVEFVPVATLDEAFAVSMAPVAKGRGVQRAVADDGGKQRTRAPRAKAAEKAPAAGAKRRPAPKKTPGTIGREMPQ